MSGLARASESPCTTPLYWPTAKRLPPKSPAVGGGARVGHNVPTQAMACDEALLRELKPFQLLDDDHRATLAKLVDLSDLPEQRVLFRAGDPGDTLYVVASGEVELAIEDNVGEKIVLAIAGKGDLFGELALLDEGSRTATATTRTPAQLIEVGRDDLLRLVQQQPDAAMGLLAAVATMTRKANEVLRT